MLSKKEIKDIQSLRYKKQRDEAGLFFAEGPKVVTELAEALPDDTVKIYALAPWAQAHAHLNLSIEVISPVELEKISLLQTPNQVSGVFKIQQNIEPVLPKNDFCLYLDAIQDPGNLGTIIRIADWFGIKNIVYTEGTADVYNPKVIQSSMASIARVNLFMDHQGDWIQKQKGAVYAATLKGKPISSFEKNKGAVLLIGNESKGLNAHLLSLATEEITIPRIGSAESLNAAVATGIILSHLIN
jgi:TrmH family RNA methyltransferase